MRKLVAVAFALALLVPMVACAGGPDLPPKAGPQEVDLINPNMGEAPDEGYETIGPIRVRVELGTNMQEQFLALRSRAAEMGADAVIYERTSSSTQGEVSGGVDREEYLYVHGMAIYWPSPDMAADTTSMGG